MNKILNQLTQGTFNIVVDFLFSKTGNPRFFSCGKHNGIKKNTQKRYHFCLKKHYQVVIIDENLFAFFSNADTTTVSVVIINFIHL